MINMRTLFVGLLVLLNGIAMADVNMKRLYLLLSNDYNKLVRPVYHNSQVVNVSINLKLSRIIDIDEKNQIMTTSVWLTQIWTDYRFMWDPKDYGNISIFYMPVADIWTPDVVLHNTANGKYELSMITKAELHSNGMVIWNIPAILRSSCMIDVEYFPFDQQNCFIKFSSWTYDSNHLQLSHFKAKEGKNLILEDGIDTSGYIESDEWDIVNLAAFMNTVPLNGNFEDFYPNIKFCLMLRRKTLFYMVNLITPCVSMSFLTVLVFSLSSNSGEKITLCISILLALTLFFLLLLDIMPPTSLVVPLLGKYLVFTITMVSLSICVTIYILNIHHRTPELYHEMPTIVRNIFLGYLPKVLFLKNLDEEEMNYREFKKQRRLQTSIVENNMGSLKYLCHDGARIARGLKLTAESFSPRHKQNANGRPSSEDSDMMLLVDNQRSTVLAATASNHSSLKRKKDNTEIKGSPKLVPKLSPMRKRDRITDRELFSSTGPLIKENLKYLTEIADFMKRDFNNRRIIHEWKLLAIVLDRVILYIFGFAFLTGTLYIFLQSPTHYADENTTLSIIQTCTYE